MSLSKKRSNQGAKWNKKMVVEVLSSHVVLSKWAGNTANLEQLRKQTGIVYLGSGASRKEQLNTVLTRVLITQAPPGQVLTCFQVWPSKIFDPVIN